MLKNKCKILLLLVVVFSLISTFCFATSEDTTLLEQTDTDLISEETEETLTTEEPHWVEGDLYISSQEAVEINQVVDGNAFVIAKEVKLTGEIGGDLFVCTNKLTIDGGYVYSSLFAAATEISLNGVVYDVYAVTNNFTLEENGFVYRDLKLSANTANLFGSVRRNAFITAGEINFNSESNEAVIQGNFKYSSSKELTNLESKVAGEVTYTKEQIKESSVASRIFDYIVSAINSIAYAVLTIVLAILLAPKFVEKVKTMGIGKSLLSILIGIATPILAIIAIILLLMSSVFAYVGFVSIFALVLLLMSGSALASIYFGTLICKLAKWEGKVKLILSTALAGLIIWAISYIPVIGGVLGFLIAMLGIGSLFMNAFSKKIKE